MNNRLIHSLAALCLSGALLAGSAVTAFATEPDYSSEIEEMTNWLNGLTVTQQAPSGGDSSTADSPAMLTDDELAAYADRMFELVNAEREQAGLALLERDGLLDEVAAIRAAEIKAVYNAGGTPHTRPDGTSFKELLNDMGIEGSRCGENISYAKPTPQDAVASWMASTKGHRENILRENYGGIGIGVYQRPDGKLDWVQIFQLQ